MLLSKFKKMVAKSTREREQYEGWQNMEKWWGKDKGEYQGRDMRQKRRWRQKCDRQGQGVCFWVTELPPASNIRVQMR
jgi:hypothetical protein